MTCGSPYTLQEGYIKSKIFDITTEIIVPKDEILFIMPMAGEVIINTAELLYSPVTANTLTVGIYMNDGFNSPIISEFFTVVNTTGSGGALTLPINLLPISASVKPVGVKTNPSFNDLHTIVNNVLDDASSTIGANIDRNDLSVRDANTYLLGAKPSVDIPVDTRLVFKITYQGTV